MSSIISKFGQYVLLQVHDDKGLLIFETDSLRVDFDVRHINRWTRAKITLFNLNPTTIKKISSGDNFVSVSVSLHGGSLTLVAEDLYISNTFEEVKVPQSEFNMYCYSGMRRKYFEKRIDVTVTSPTIPKVVKQIAEAGGFTGVIEYKHFPSDILSFVPPNPTSHQSGSLLSCLAVYGAERDFNFYTEVNKLIIVYKPNARNYRATDFYSNPADVVLSTKNMRSNPKIGPSTLSIVSNLDPSIKPSSVLDISDLLTATADVPEETLFVAKQYLADKIAGFTKYIALSVQHKGSNWTGNWLTQVSATSPTPGTDMPTVKWWG